MTAHNSIIVSNNYLTILYTTNDILYNIHFLIIMRQCVKITSFMFKWLEKYKAKKLWMKNAEIMWEHEEMRNLACLLFTEPHGEYAQMIAEELTLDEIEAVTDVWRVTRLMTYPGKKFRREMKVLKDALEFKRNP